MSQPESGKTPEPDHSSTSMLLDFLAHHDAPCPACGYSLHKLTQPTCPECGLTLKLSVGSDTPFKRAWAITLCINAMIAGAGALLLLIYAFEGSPYNSGLGLIGFFGPMFWIPVPLIIFSARNWFCGLPSGVQNAAIGASIFFFLLFGYAISDLLV